MAAQRILVLGAVALCAVAQGMQRPFVLPVPQNPERYATLATVADEAACADEVRVPVTLGVMSRCPDALFCEGVIDDVLGAVGDLADVALTFIGTCGLSLRLTRLVWSYGARRPNASDGEWGVTCKHGPGECLGNVLELCAVALEPPRPEDVELTWRPRWWDFTLCMNAAGAHALRAHTYTADTSA